MRLIRNILETLFWMMAAGMLLFVIAVIISIGGAPGLAIFAIVCVLLALPLWVRMLHVNRRRRGATILSYLDQAVRLNLPLARMLWAAQRSETGVTAQRLSQIRLRLEDGLDIGPTLELVAPEVPSRAVSIVSAAERLGRLPQALHRLVSEQTTAARRDPRNVPFYGTAYPMALLIVMGGVLSMIGVFVMPKFTQVLKDMHTPVPPLTIAVFDMASMLAPPLIIVIAIIVLFTAGRQLWETAHPARIDTVGLGRVWDRVKWFTPILHAIERDRALADVCALMAESLRAGTPIDVALREAATLRVNAIISDRVEGWWLRVSAGRSLHDAARTVGMPALMCGMLATAREGHAAAEVFDFLQRYYASRFSRYVAILQGAIVPAVVFVFGTVVALIGMSMFLPLAKMADSMVPELGRL